MHPDTTSSSGAPHGGAHAVLRLATLALALVLLTLAGCAQIPHASVVGEQEQIEIPDRPLPVANGSIFQKARGYQPLFEDRRPRSVGDILTIVLDEEVSASKNSSANAGRDGSARPDAPCRTSFSPLDFPMFVPSLSWQKDHF